jgi:hypothetical protein
LETGGNFASERSHPFVHPAILSKNPIPLGQCQDAPELIDLCAFALNSFPISRIFSTAHYLYG